MIQYRKYNEESIAIEKRLWKDAEKTIPFNLERYEIQIHIIRVSNGLVARNSQGLPMIYKDEDITKVENDILMNGEDGYATILGKVRGIDTRGLNVGETWQDGNYTIILN